MATLKLLGSILVLLVAFLLFLFLVVDPLLDYGAPGNSIVVPRGQQSTRHVLFCLRGGLHGFIQEFDVSLKSVLLNAPIDHDLQVHIMADKAAVQAIQARIDDLRDSRWRNSVSLLIYDVTTYEQEWQSILRKKLRGLETDPRITLGGYYRLFAHLVLPSVTSVLYLDTDVVVLANLNQLWEHANDLTLYQFSASDTPNNGFMLMNIDKFGRFWDLVDGLPEINSGCQALMILFRSHYASLVGSLPVEWDTHLVRAWRKKPHMLVNQPAAGMLHFNGIRDNNESYFEKGLEQYCERSRFCSQSVQARSKFDQSWGIADYYVKLPWAWVKFFGQSIIRMGEAGHSLKIKLI